MRILATVTVLCGLLTCGLSIMCYECNSATNSLCSHKFLPDNLKRNCSDHDRGVTHTLCRKIVQDVDYGVDGHSPQSRVIRSCGWDESKYKGVCYQRSGFGGRQEVCSCTTDFCNSSNKTFISSTLLISIVLLFIKNNITTAVREEPK
ncbi:uncharacterized protein LOC113232306 [Hyposmocoma kahamanoa]|uniref:uncharacterized protein LOC113232306 n=1 Tax=Hyposmocoma kahamanoa TaxID=1477025 RepID=UPI000E6D9C4A|nr:uncharacterized protein LOC113232306 [Hyposmocoma kahamanoa]